MTIAVLEKAFSTIEVLARARRSLTLAELAAESRLPKPSLYRILLSLRNLGYVEQAERRGAYHLSTRLSSLREHGRDEALRLKALPLMKGLRQQFDETVNLGVLEGIFVRYVQVLETGQSLRWIVKPGARDPFQTTALGRAIVAGLAPDQQRRLIRKVVAAGPAAGRRARRDALVSELMGAQRRGFAADEEETTTGVACLAISLDWLGEPLAAISVSVPTNRFPPSRRAALLGALRGLRQAALAV